MLLPARLNDAGIEPALRTDRAGVEQVLGPWPQGPLYPLSDGDAEAGLRPVDQLARDKVVEELADDLLSLAVTNLEIERNPRGKLGYAMVKEGHAGLERHRHGRAIHLHEDVVGQIADRIAIHHARRVGCARAGVEVEARGSPFPADDGRALLAPFV